MRLSAFSIGAVYALIVFGIGFVLGVLRTLVVAPRVGPLIAVAAEAPLMLAASWLVWRAIARSQRVQPSAPTLAAAGAVAFLVLQALEFALSMALGRSAAQFLTGYLQPEGQVGLVAQVLFAMIPLLARLSARAAPPS